MGPCRAGTPRGLTPPLKNLFTAICQFQHHKRFSLLHGIISVQHWTQYTSKSINHIYYRQGNQTVQVLLLTLKKWNTRDNLAPHCRKQPPHLNYISTFTNLISLKRKRSMFQNMEAPTLWCHYMWKTRSVAEAWCISECQVDVKRHYRVLFFFLQLLFLSSSLRLTSFSVVSKQICIVCLFLVCFR